MIDTYRKAEFFLKLADLCEQYNGSFGFNCLSGEVTIEMDEKDVYEIHTANVPRELREVARTMMVTELRLSSPPHKDLL